MGNGNNTGYAEVVVEMCSGEQKVLTFKEDVFRHAREKANRAVGSLSVIAMGGNDVAHMKDPEGWFNAFPSSAHIIKIMLNKRNLESEKITPVSERAYGCAHTRRRTNDHIIG